MKTKIYFRADGHAKMGLGHVIRSLALAEMLMEDFDCHFIIRNPLPSLKTQILEVCKSIIELPETDDHNAEAQMLADKYLSGEEIVVLDGYHFRTEYQRIVKNKGCKLVCIDDIHAYHFVADVVINHAPGLKRSDYSVEKYTNLCLGLEYSLLRKPFLEAAAQPHEISNMNTIFICFGGADPLGLTLKTLQVLQKFESFKRINCITGVSFSEYEKMNEILRMDKRIFHFQNVGGADMVDIMKSSNFGIVPSSSVLLEALACGVKCITCYYVKNQEEFHNNIIEHGVKTIGKIDEAYEGRLFKQLQHINNGFMVAHDLRKKIAQSKSNNYIHFLKINQNEKV